MELFEMLRQDHQKVRQLFSQFDDMKEEPEKNRKALEKVFSTLQKELKTHMEGEERHFYPALREAEETHSLVLEAFEEHHVVKLLMRELERIQLSEKWIAKLSVMKENVQHHLEEEEEELFEKAQQILDPEQTRKVGEQIARMRH
ncbi:MAG: hemerythrin domain-containing protein [Desulfuromonadales bacterium]|nr:hemerythrin domain-containing protein [Desulfuromonadales bacterium]